MLRYAEDVAEVVRRGGVVFADSRLLAVRCIDCHHDFLHDESSGRLFLDPADLKQVAQEQSAPPCPQCGREDWTFETVPAEDLDAYIAGRWGFCFWTPRLAAPRSTRRRVAIAVVAGTLVVVGAVALSLNPEPFAAPGHGRPQVQVRTTR